MSKRARTDNIPEIAYSDEHTNLLSQTTVGDCGLSPTPVSNPPSPVPSPKIGSLMPSPKSPYALSGWRPGNPIRVQLSGYCLYTLDSLNSALFVNLKVCIGNTLSLECILQSWTYNQKKTDFGSFTAKLELALNCCQRTSPPNTTTTALYINC